MNYDVYLYLCLRRIFCLDIVEGIVAGVVSEMDQ